MNNNISLYKLKKIRNGVHEMRKRVPKRVLNMAKNPINIRSKTPLVSTLTRATRLNDGHIETVLGHY